VAWRAARRARSAQCAPRRSGNTGRVARRRQAPVLAPTQPSQELEAWLDPSQVRDSSRTLELKHQITELVESRADEGETVTRAVVIELAERPDVQEDFDDYLPQWQTWATEDQRLKPIHDVYSTLHVIQQRVVVLQELYEVVLGVGLLTCPRGAGTVRRHLLVAKADIELEAETGRISVGPAADGLDLQLEDEMIEPADLPPASVVRSLQAGVSELGDPLPVSAAAPLLKSWANASSQDARYDDSVIRPSTIESALTVTHAPALLLRRRSRRAVVDFCRTVIDELDQGAAHVPGAIRDLVEQAPSGATNNVDDGAADPAGPLPIEPLFPLPANDEQLEIVERLGRAPGIIVEGPPGTGKSHTIANLIAHLTANGKRVLVTSHTARALLVLKGKLPDGIAELCVDVLGEGRERRENLERSITAVLRRANDPKWAQRQITARIADLERKRGQLRDERAALLAEQRRIRELEVTEFHPGIGGYHGSLSTIADRIAREREDHEWFADVPDGPPVEALGSLSEFVALARDITAEEAELASRRAPAPSELPTPSEVREAWEAIGGIQQRVGGTRTREARLIAEAGQEVREELASCLSAMVTARRDALRTPVPWAAAAVRDVLARRDERWGQLATLTNGVLAALDGDLADVDMTHVAGLGPANYPRLGPQARALLQHLQGGGKMSSLFGRPEPVRQATELLQTVRVNGRVPDDVPALTAMLRWASTNEQLGTAEAAWASNLRTFGPSASQRRAALKAELDDLTNVLRLRERLNAFDAALARVAGLLAPDWEDEASVRQSLQDIDQASAMQAETKTRGILVDRISPLRELAGDPQAHAGVAAALTALDGHDLDRYALALEALAAHARATSRVARRDALAADLRRVMPLLIGAIEARPHDPVWEARAPSINEAWEWRRATIWLAESSRARSTDEIGAEITRLDEQIVHADRPDRGTQGLAARLARHRRLRKCELRAIPGSDAAIREGHRQVRAAASRDARSYLRACQDAVPVWIMPTHLVAERSARSPSSSMS